MTNSASFLRRLLSNRSFTIGASLVGLVVVLALLVMRRWPRQPSSALAAT
jgi:hypothetical protein